MLGGEGSRQKSRCYDLLTSATLEYLKASFRLERLHRSFREAIQITRELGVRYLWIDSLCIIQESKEDWRYEAATMVRVYENSYCNISAAKAFDSEQGYFSQRDPLSIHPIITRTSWQNAFNTAYHFYSEFFWWHQVGKTPLNQSVF